MNEKIEKAIKEMGFRDLTEVQKKTIPLMLQGKNVVVRAKTGSGKTAAYAIPILELGMKSLVVAPTRELTRQVASHIRDIGRYMDVNVAEVYGGMPYRTQTKRVKDANIIVATPGRLLDLWSKGIIDLSSFDIVIIDEADLMFEMGFIDDIKIILAQTNNRKITGLFSATIPEEIRKVIKDFIINYEEIEACIGLANVDHRFVHVEDDWRSKVKALKENKDKGVIVFVRTRNRVAKLVRLFDNAIELRGDLPQSVRNRNIDAFREGEYDMLITTDVASRGLDIPLVEKVINFDAPQDLRTYIHRIGRTGRMGRKGEAVTFILDEYWLEKEVKKLSQKT
ncbi:DEAD/DEAH box helicase [Sulfolobus sp. S-194]|uniref:DEAD/DEAH box helicase n=1 Tax=Sulfolobus sp. S-194 TaxID=2512240 RepID=UPI001436E9ED|nr:DEAD/DEAH box helicase [Sulfolobus sp. S-194]QIW25233.1 DEAD/DEAH box helicase [Sulfolobus sp. S-194]